MKVSEIMSARPAIIAAEASLDEAMELMEQRRLRHLPVMDGGQLAGMISDRDLLEATGWLPPSVREVLDAPTGCVADFMHEDPVTVAPDDDLAAIAARFSSGHLGCVPVLRGGELVGVVTETDLLRLYADACRDGRIAPDEDPTVAACMAGEVTTCDPTTPVDEILELLKEQDIRHVPVVEGRRLVGIVSDRDVRLAIGRGQLAGTAAREIMTGSPAFAGPEDRLSAAAATLVAEKVSALPVIEDDRLVGMLTLADVFRVLRDTL